MNTLGLLSDLKLKIEDFHSGQKHGKKDQNRGVGIVDDPSEMLKDIHNKHKIDILSHHD